MWLEPHLSKHRRRQLFINVTSLVDVLFILLIFFALSTTFDRLGALELNLPKAKSSKPATTQKNHEINIQKNGTYSLDGVTVSKKALIAKVRGWSFYEKSLPVVLKADQKTPYGDVVGLLDELRREGILKIEALTRRS